MAELSPPHRVANRCTLGLDDATIAVSEEVRSSMGQRQADVEVIVHGIDTRHVRRHLTERTAVRAELGIGDDDVLAVTVANLRRAKGYPTLIEAARLVADQEPSIHFVAAGQGPLEDELRARVTAAGLDARFRMLGYVPDAARLIAGADLLVLASDHEGLPLAVMEALALGVPVVATRVGGIPELVEDQVNGLLVPPGDPAALAAGIGALADTPTRRRLAAGADARGAQVDGDAAVVRLDEIYAELANPRVR